MICSLENLSYLGIAFNGTNKTAQNLGQQHLGRIFNIMVIKFEFMKNTKNVLSTMIRDIYQVALLKNIFEIFLKSTQLKYKRGQ